MDGMFTQAAMDQDEVENEPALRARTGAFGNFHDSAWSRREGEAPAAAPSTWVVGAAEGTWMRPPSAAPTTLCACSCAR
jgi:hypothetical protein